jgi:hypothetical protein
MSSKSIVGVQNKWRLDGAGKSRWKAVENPLASKGRATG